MIESGDKRFLLRLASLSDVDDMLEYNQHEDFTRYTLAAMPITRQSTLEYLRTRIEKTKTKPSDYLHYVIVDRASMKVIGDINLSIKEHSKHAYIGYALSPSFWRKGYATAAIRSVCNYVFQETRIKKLYARVVDANVSSVKVLLNNHFRRDPEGADSITIRGRQYSSSLYYCKKE